MQIDRSRNSIIPYAVDPNKSICSSDGHDEMFPDNVRGTSNAYDMYVEIIRAMDNPFCIGSDISISKHRYNGSPYILIPDSVPDIL